MRLRQLLTIFVDSCFPPREDELLLRGRRSDALVSFYVPQRLPDEAVALSPFAESLVRAAIHETKFHYNRHAARLLAVLLTKHTAILPKEALYLPIPLSRKRYRERGYNQVCEVLAAAHLPYRTDILHRTRHTKPQTSLGRAERLHNLAGAFVVSKRALASVPKDQPLVIVDDVTTTGATLREAASALRVAAANPLTLLALAH